MTTRVLRALALCALIAIEQIVLTAQPAAAHPLGNFTVNRYARVEAAGRTVRVYYVLDEAEIPAFQERDAVRSDPDGFSDGRANELASGLKLVVDGVPAPLRVERRQLSEPPGQGGLSTLRLDVLLAAELPGNGDGPRAVRFSDENEPDRLGWREVVVVSRGGARIERSDAPRRDRSDELRSYPAALTQSPLDVRGAGFTFTPGDDVVPEAMDSSGGAVERGGGRLTALVTRGDLTPWVLAGMLGIAFLVGSAHALAPGHGKTVMAAYLAGSRGRPLDAVAVGTTVSLMHTASVLVLGLVLFKASRSTAIDRIYPVLTLVSGAVVLGIGGFLLRTRLRQRRRHHHHRDPDGRHQDHHHDLPSDVSPLSRRGLAVLAGSGGLLPSPSAVIVLISAFTLGRAVLGLALIAAFSLGLAATLTAVGLAFVFGRGLFERRGLSLRALPVLGAAALTMLGGILVVQGAFALG